ncbi:MAG TPA: patatin-like phospholipase family protein [Blastocatellia bacterium]|nr:patatin-like phospholipase family protein [Blastocatellia bacterium]
MPVYRILTLDGGGQLEMTSTLLLGEIEKKRPGFLAKTNLIAGTSAGAMVGLILATRDNPADLLPATDKLWQDFFFLSMNSFAGAMLGLVGLGALFSNERLEQYLAQADLLGDKTLGDLKKRVLITAFNLDDKAQHTGHRIWKPKVFHNCGSHDEPDLEEKAVDVALRSGASPIFFPAVDNYIDGGMFANHPAMAAVSQILADWRHGYSAGAEKPGVLEDLRVLSVGVGQDKEYADTGDGNWGYFNWVLNPFKPLLLLGALMRGDSWAVNFECKHVMPQGHYHRLDPYYIVNSYIPGMVDTAVIRKTVESDDTQKLIDRTVEWLDKCGWFEEGN